MSFSLTPEMVQSVEPSQQLRHLRHHFMNFELDRKRHPLLHSMDERNKRRFERDRRKLRNYFYPTELDPDHPDERWIATAGTSGSGKSEVLKAIAVLLGDIRRTSEIDYDLEVAYVKSGDGLGWAEKCADPIITVPRDQATPEMYRRAYSHIARVVTEAEKYLSPSFRWEDGKDSNKVKGFSREGRRGRLYFLDNVGFAGGTALVEHVIEKGGMVIAVHAPHDVVEANMNKRMEIREHYAKLTSKEISKKEFERRVRKTLRHYRDRDKRPIEQIVDDCLFSGNRNQLKFQQDAIDDAIRGYNGRRKKFKSLDHRDKYMVRTHYPREMRKWFGSEAAYRERAVILSNLEAVNLSLDSPVFEVTKFEVLLEEVFRNRLRDILQGQATAPDAESEVWGMIKHFRELGMELAGLGYNEEYGFR